MEDKELVISAQQAVERCNNYFNGTIFDKTIVDHFLTMLNIGIKKATDRGVFNFEIAAKPCVRNINGAIIYEFSAKEINYITRYLKNLGYDVYLNSTKDKLCIDWYPY